MKSKSLLHFPLSRAAGGLLGLCLAAAAPASAQNAAPAPQVDRTATDPAATPAPTAEVRPIAAAKAQGEAGASAPSVEQLRAQVQEWDKRRSEAANAMFRLGEAYRKQKMFDQAQRSYVRVAKEFQDFP